MELDLDNSGPCLNQSFSLDFINFKKESESQDPEAVAEIQKSDSESFPGIEATAAQPAPIKYLSALKEQIGNVDAVVQFEQFFNTQTAELLFVKQNYEQLRSALNKSQEDRRGLELQLVAERSLRAQEGKTFHTSIENNAIQLNAQLYAQKFEVENWKQKTEAMSMESQLLKDQLKVVEAEKCAISKQLSDIMEKSAGYENFRKTFELLVMRIRDTTQDIKGQLDSLHSAEERLSDLLNTFREDINVQNVYVKTQAEKIAFLEQRCLTLESEFSKR